MVLGDDVAKKIKKRMIISINKLRGGMAEKVYELNAGVHGKEIKRTGKGSDYIERDIDFLSGKKSPWTKVEIKSGDAKLSELQKGTKMKSKRYRIDRY